MFDVTLFETNHHTRLHHVLVTRSASRMLQLLHLATSPLLELVLFDTENVPVVIQGLAVAYWFVSKLVEELEDWGGTHVRIVAKQFVLLCQQDRTLLVKDCPVENVDLPTPKRAIGWPSVQFHAIIQHTLRKHLHDQMQPLTRTLESAILQRLMPLFLAIQLMR